MLRFGLNRHDIEHEWLFDRCREVQNNPNGYLDLWFRAGYKDLCNATPMLTANRGWTTHGELHVGDMVFNENGEPVSVLALSDRYTDSECYSIQFNDGEEIIAGEGHLWRTKRKIRRRISGTNQRTTEWVTDITNTASLEAKTRIEELASPLEYSVKQLPIHPYVLGVWLGDGASAGARITSPFSDIAIINKIRSLGVEARETKCPTLSCANYTLNPGIKGKKNTGMTSVLRKMGLKNNKHIPEDYLQASKHQRLELLKGLMDTDGHNNGKGKATFSNANERLAKDVYDLARSLAYRPSINTYKHKTGPFVGYKYWHVSFRAHTDKPPFSLPRKADRCIEPTYYRGNRYVKSVTPVKSRPTRCIQVEGGMYLAGKSLVPTHNSTIITFALTIQDILASHGDEPLDKWQGREPVFGIFSHTRPIAKGFLRQIKREFESNALLKELYPDILWENPHRESPKWSEDEGIVLRRKSNPKESTVEAHGLVDGQPTSRHFSVRVYDDVVTRESVTTPEMIKKTTEAWELSDNLGTEDGIVRTIGTRYHLHDTYNTMMKRKVVTPRLYPATEDGTVEGEPVLLSREALDEKYRIQGSYVFNCQMLQNPIADKSQGFKSSWLQYYIDNNPEPNKYSTMNKLILIDPANEKKKKSDYTAMWVLGYNSDNKIYVLDMIRDKMNLHERTTALMDLHKRWRPKQVGYEKYGKDTDIEHIEYVQNENNYRFKITPLGGIMGKNDRIRRLVPDFENEVIWFPRRLMYTTIEGQEVDLVRAFIEDEFIEFPVAEHDDMLDSLARCKDEEIKVRFPRGQYEAPTQVIRALGGIKKKRNRAMA